MRAKDRHQIHDERDGHGSPPDQHDPRDREPRDDEPIGNDDENDSGTGTREIREPEPRGLTRFA